MLETILSVPAHTPCATVTNKLLCPGCGNLSTFTGHFSYADGSEPNQEWLTCDSCGGDTDRAELHGVQPTNPCEVCQRREVTGWSDAADANVCDTCYDEAVDGNAPDCLAVYKESL